MNTASIRESPVSVTHVGFSELTSQAYIIRLLSHHKNFLQFVNLHVDTITKDSCKSSNMLSITRLFIWLLVNIIAAVVARCVPPSNDSLALRPVSPEMGTLMNVKVSVAVLPLSPKRHNPQVHVTQPEAHLQAL